MNNTIYQNILVLYWVHGYISCCYLCIPAFIRTNFHRKKADRAGRGAICRTWPLAGQAELFDECSINWPLCSLLYRPTLSTLFRWQLRLAYLPYHTLSNAIYVELWFRDLAPYSLTSWWWPKRTLSRQQNLNELFPSPYSLQRCHHHQHALLFSLAGNGTYSMWSCTQR